MLGRRILLFGTPLACVLVALAVAPFAVGWMLPRPRDCDRELLGRWLVLRDVPSLAPATQLELLDSLQRQYSRVPTAPPPVPQSLSATLRTQLQRNLDFLKQFWFVQRVEQFHGQPAGDRTRFLDQQIAFADKWSLIEPGGGDNLAVFAQVDEWLDAARDKPQRLRMEEALRAAMTRWLATHDLAEYPQATRDELTRRIVEDLEYGAQLDGRGDGFGEAERKTLLANAELLIEAWLLQQAQAYKKLPPPRRTAWLDQQIAKVNDWGLARMLNPSPASAPPPNSLNRLPRLVAQLQKWVKRAPESQRSDLQLLVQHLLQLLFLRQFLKTPAK